MPANKRTVYFYRLIVEEENTGRNADGHLATRITPITNAVSLQLFQEIYASMQELHNGCRAKTVNLSRSTVVVEVISINDSMVFARIGQPNSANTVGIRDERTLEINDVPMGPNQNLELFTYCLIDFETGVVSYIGIQGAPKINALGALFSSHDFGRTITARLAAILTDDIIQLIAHKNIIGKISFTVTIPNDDVLANVVDVGANEFDALRNVKYREATYDIVANRNKNVFERSSNLSNLVDALVGRFGDGLRKLKVRAKDYTESMQTYDLMDYNFTRKVTLGNPKDHNTLTEDDFLEALKKTYLQNKNDLLKYTRID